MSELAKRYARALFEVYADEDAFRKSRDLLKEPETPGAEPVLWQILMNPCVVQEQKQAVLQRVLGPGFAPELVRFHQLLCSKGRLSLLDDVLGEYRAIVMESRNAADAELTCAFVPDAGQRDRITRKLCAEFGKREIVLHIREDASLLGGFVLRIGDMTYDRSVRGALRGLQNAMRHSGRSAVSTR